MENVRPETLEEFVGQEKITEIIKIHIESAQKQNSTIGHLLMSGPSGLGKSSLAKVVSYSFGTHVHEVVASNIQTPSQLIHILTSLRHGDFLFIDELHGLNRPTEELLYAAMEDFVVPVENVEFNSLMKQLGVASAERQASLQKLCRFTCIGATTLVGNLSSPLRSRYVQHLKFEPYTVDDLECIVIHAAKKLGLEVSRPVARIVAKRARSTARIAVGYTRWIAEYCMAKDLSPDQQTVEKALHMQGVDEDGLTSSDLDYLNVLIRSDTPQGLSTIATSLDESIKAITETIEPFLIRQGYIQKSPRGRIALPKARERIGAS